MSPDNFPDYLRTLDEGKSLAVEVARANFSSNPSVDAYVIGDVIYLLTSEAFLNGSMDFEMAARFGSAA